MLGDTTSTDSPSDVSDSRFDNLVWSTDSIPLWFRRRLDVLEGAAVGNKISAYQGFGSFHSENVEDLVAQSTAVYRPPLLRPFALRVLTATELAALGNRDRDNGDNNINNNTICQRPIEVQAFGLPFRHEHFAITPHFVFINHGAFGGSLRGAIAIKRGYEDLMEQQVVSFMDRELLPLIVYSVRRLAEFLNARPTQIVFMQNASYALNCAMNLIEEDDIVAFLDTEYLSVYKMMYFRCKKVGAPFYEMPLSKYLHQTEILGDDAALTDYICSALPEGCTTFIFDYVTSTSALCLPAFSHLIPALRQRGVTKIIVDGAHAPLQIDLNFNDLPAAARPSVFVGNLHKWFSAPKSVGFMWVHEEVEDSIRSVVVSHGAGEGLLSEFIWDGTRDYGACLTVPAVIDFWRAQGVERVRNHCSALLRNAAEMLTAAFRSRPVARHAPFMSLVELPEALQDELMTAKHIQDLLHNVYKLEVPIKRVEERLYVRISAFVYNTPSDYAYLREAVLAIAKQYEKQKLSTSDAGKMSNAPKVPCDKQTRLRNGCSLTALEPLPKRRKTADF